jgi:oligoribonuclease
MKVIFLDIETTGLDPASDKILEVACALVDSQLNPIDGFTSVIRPATLLPPMDPYVQEMHTKNSLFVECSTGPTMPDVNKALCDWLYTHAGGQKASLTLAGNSVHFDLSFLKAQLPIAAQWFSHRLLDVSAFRVGREYIGLDKCPLVAASAHRACGDVEASIAQARWYLSRVTP